MGPDKTILLFDDFERDEPAPDKEMVGNGWETDSKGRAGGKKQVDLDNGALHVTLAAAADRVVSVWHDPAYSNVLVELRFQLAEGSDLAVHFADMRR